MQVRLDCAYGHVEDLANLREAKAFLVAQDEYLYERLELAFREGYMQGYASRRAAYTNGAYSKGYTEGFTEGLTFTPDAEAES